MVNSITFRIHTTKITTTITTTAGDSLKTDKLKSKFQTRKRRTLTLSKTLEKLSKEGTYGEKERKERAEN